MQNNEQGAHLNECQRPSADFDDSLSFLVETRTCTEFQAKREATDARSYCICCMTAMFSMTSLSICRFFQLTSPGKQSTHDILSERSAAGAADLHGVRVAPVDERDVTEVPGDRITNIHGKKLGAHAKKRHDGWRRAVMNGA
jgi:hypothetical protein